MWLGPTRKGKTGTERTVLPENVKMKSEMLLMYLLTLPFSNPVTVWANMMMKQIVRMVRPVRNMHAAR